MPPSVIVGLMAGMGIFVRANLRAEVWKPSSDAYEDQTKRHELEYTVPLPESTVFFVTLQQGFAVVGVAIERETEMEVCIQEVSLIITDYRKQIALRIDTTLEYDVRVISVL